MDQPTLKLVPRLKGKSREIMCNYNSRLRDTHKHTQAKEVKKKMIKYKHRRVSKNGSKFRMCSSSSGINLK